MIPLKNRKMHDGRMMVTDQFYYNIPLAFRVKCNLVHPEYRIADSHTGTLTRKHLWVNVGYIYSPYLGHSGRATLLLRLFSQFAEMGLIDQTTVDDEFGWWLLHDGIKTPRRFYLTTMNYLFGNLIRRFWK